MDFEPYYDESWVKNFLVWMAYHGGQDFVWKDDFATVYDIFFIRNDFAFNYTEKEAKKSISNALYWLKSNGYIEKFKNGEHGYYLTSKGSDLADSIVREHKRKDIDPFDDCEYPYDNDDDEDDNVAFNTAMDAFSNAMDAFKVAMDAFKATMKRN